MATITGSVQKGWRLYFYDGPNGLRKGFRLPKGLDKRAAHAVKLKVEQLLAHKLANVPIPQELASWLGGLGDELYERLAECGLVPPRARRVTVAELIREAQAAAEKDGVKPSTLTAYHTAGATLSEFLGSKPAHEVTADDAAAYREWLLQERKLRPCTVARRMSYAKSVFEFAIGKGWIERNPFAKVSRPVGNPKERWRYVTLEETQRLLEACPNHYWKLIIGLARYAGLRIPSEALYLTIEDVHWDDPPRLIVFAPKTERSKPYRTVPIIPLLRPILLEACERLQPGERYLFPESWRKKAQGGWRSCNLRRRFETIIRRAGLEPWPRLFQNLRASFETDLYRDFPASVVTSWLGHSSSVSLKHYVEATDRDFYRATNWVPRGHVAPEALGPVGE
jgi:integrase